MVLRFDDPPAWPESALASDDSAAGVHVLDDIHKSRHGLDQGKGRGAEYGIAVL